MSGHQVDADRGCSTEWVGRRPGQRVTASSMNGLRVANAETYALAEGPFWDPVRQRLLWVDIGRGLVLVGHLEPDGTIEIVDRVQFTGTVAAVAVAQDGSWVVAGSSELLVRSPSGDITVGPQILPNGSDRRLNDGKPDPAGRYIVGSLSLGDESAEEILVAVDEHGWVSVLDDDLTLSNGLGWTADGTLMGVVGLPQPLWTGCSSAVA
jgi:sugar lactone lactonase YvrE